MPSSRSFEYIASPSRVVFGKGSLSKLHEEIARLDKSRPLLLSTPEQESEVKKLQQSLQDASMETAGVFGKATMHTPINVTDDALEFAKGQQADSIVSYGGGSTIGLGKAISVRTGLPHICIPTTYAGSEMTPILGETVGDRKMTRSDPSILPTTVIYDVDLTLTLPAGMSVTSGVNAIAHAGRSTDTSNRLTH